MGGSIVFVHGTGVRGTGYQRTFSQIHSALGGARQLHGCFWGDTEGARLRADGASIPTYEDTRGKEPSEEEQELARWAVLYTDPWYELRLLRVAGGGTTDLPPGAVSPAEALRDQVAAFIPSPTLRTELETYALADAFDDALEELRASSEFDEAAETAPVEPLEHRAAVARALLAHALVATSGDGLPTIDGAIRDALTALVIDELLGSGRGVGAWLAKPFKGIAARVMTGWVTRRRGAISDSTGPAAGDILRYQARGDGIRAAIRQAVQDTDDDDVTLLAHSLGGIACVDALVLQALPSVTRLITVGSQAPYFYEIGALHSLEHPATLPDHFPRWLNIYDRRDMLSYLGAGVFPGRVDDIEVDNRQPFPQSHSAYWSNSDVWSAVEDFVGRP